MDRNASGRLHVLTDGHLRIPTPDRRIAGIATGDRLLVTPEPRMNRLTVFTPDLLDSILHRHLSKKREQ
ncbi:hypothetical protein [Nocardia sp. NPDC059239]|uniref:hypothetical protein n=1 Tax=Nocardia sp. NPDC059239 TaxID=3346785 RepID=UPI00368DE8DF